MPTRLPRLPQLIEGLIAKPSISSATPGIDTSNRAVIDQLATWLDDLGFSTRILPIPGAPGKYNLIATLGRGGGGLILAGHTDTVPTNASRWRHDPFKLTEADGRYYGLGTSDMKSFLALAIEAARDLDPKQMRQPLIILATADEETTMSGAAALSAADLHQGRFAVIGEPTGLRPVNQHKGILMESIRLIGRAGHSSNPDHGNSALEGMQQLMARLLDYRRQLQQRHRNPAFEVQTPTLNLGHIHGGQGPNQICGECELHVDLRPLPGMSIEKLRRELRQITAETAQARQLEYECKPLFAGIDAMSTPADSPLVRAAASLTGKAPEAVAFGTEGPYLRRLGIDTLILGPGDIAQAHQPNEYLALARIDPMLKILRQLIQRFCLQDVRPQ